MSDQKPVYVVGCRMLQSALEPLLAKLPGITGAQYLDYGLHTLPVWMTPQLQAAIDSAQEPGIILMGYGLCGNGLVGLEAGPHTLVIPRTDDCIGILFGSQQNFLAYHRRHPATYYLSEGWLESGYHPVGQFKEWSEQYGEERARRVIDQMYGNYERVMLIAFTADQLARYRPQAQAVADFMGVAYEETIGRPTLLERLIRQIEEPGPTDDDFVIVPPGGVVQQQDFIR